MALPNGIAAQDVFSINTHKTENSRNPRYGLCISSSSLWILIGILVEHASIYFSFFFRFFLVFSRFLKRKRKKREKKREKKEREEEKRRKRKKRGERKEKEEKEV